jgi:uncharacterized membrane protein YphA (DoxX/SURF4 family)
MASSTTASPLAGSLEMPPWKNLLSHTAALVVAFLFICAGVYKAIDPYKFANLAKNLLVPYDLTLPLALLLAVAETTAGILILVPRFRRWGAWLTGALLVVFLGYFAINYSALAGQDCSCFPWLKRVVGPGFFIGDAAMLLLAIVAGIWAKPSGSMRSATVILAAVSVFALVSYGVEVTRQTGVEAPATITVDGKPFSTHQGKVFIYFLNPECMHCFDAAKKMSKMNWGDTKLIGVPVEQKQFAGQFLQDTGLKAAISYDVDVLKKTFPFVNAPAAVALVNGREKAMITNFDAGEPETTLKKLDFIY